VSYSLNEASALAKKATRGAGYSWGMAEEAARAIRWLEERSLDGCGALAALIEFMDGAKQEEARPIAIDDRWSAECGALCPISAGTLLADRAALLGSTPIVLENLVAPLLLLPFGADAEKTLGLSLTLQFKDAAFTSDGAQVSGAEITHSMSDVGIAFGMLNGKPRPLASRVFPSGNVWERLNIFANRTYAPATEASRLKGAGAGTSDND